MTSIRRLMAMLVCIPAFSVLGLSVSSPADADVAAFVDDYLSRAVIEKEIPGAAIVLLRDGKVLLEKTYGVADYRSGRPISSENSILRQGSMAKLFVWVLVMQLVEEGRIGLDVDINRYLDFRIDDTFDSPITMRHLMTHSAGFADKMPMVDGRTRDAAFPVQIRENVPERVYPPGTTIAYSNYGAALAGYIVERLRGKPFETIVEERLFAPLGMTRSTLAQPLPPHLQPLLVSNYSSFSRTPASFDTLGLAPAGSASTSPRDMGRFLMMLMSGGSGIVSPDALSAMMHVDRPLGPEMTAGLGLGFIVGEYRGVRYAGHGGSMPAGTTDLQILPGQGVGWYLGFNGRGGNGAAVPLRQELLRAVIDRFYAQALTTVIPSRSTASEVAGMYLPARRLHSGVMKIFSVLASLDVAAEGDALRIELEGNTTRWLKAGPDRFVEERTGLPLAISRDASGKIVRLGSPLLNSVSHYEPAHAAARYLPLLVAAPLVLLFVALMQPISRAIGRLRGEKSARPEASGVRRAADAAVWVIVAITFAWALYLMVQVVDPGILSGSGILPKALQLMSAATPVAAAIIAAAALSAWRDPARSHWRAAQSAVTVCAAAAAVWLLFAFDLAAV